MQIIKTSDRNHLGQYVGTQASAILREKLARQKQVNLVVATGSSQFEVLGNLIAQPDIDWSRVHGFHLDEYLGIDIDHPASFCGYLRDRFVSHLSLGSFHYLDGTLPPEELKHQAAQAIGGQSIDLMLCGVGENGHLAFNDPPADFATEDPYLIVQLDEACRRQQVGEGWFETLDDVPTRAISMSIRQIMRAEAILCSVPDARKAEAVKNAIEGSVTPDVPASILQRHPNVQIVLDRASAAFLDSKRITHSHDSLR